MPQQAMSGVALAVVDTNAQALHQCPLPHRLQIGLQVTGGCSTGGSPELGRAAAEQDAAALQQLVGSASLVFVVAGLGGGTGTGAAPVLARLAREAGARVLGLVTLPFEWEGNLRLAQALAGLELLQAAADGLLCLPQQTLYRMMAPETPVPQAFLRSAELLTMALQGLCRLATCPRQFGVDFADLTRVLQAGGASSVFGTAETQGADHARELPDKLLASPLLASGHALAEATDVLVSLIGGPDLPVSQVEYVKSQIERRAQRAHLITGVAIDEQWTDRVAVMLIASCAAAGQAARHPVGCTQASHTTPTATTAASELDGYLLDPEQRVRPPSRFVPPPPELSEAQKRELLAQQAGGSVRRRGRLRWYQGQLPLEIISRGRFEKSEPTIYRGQDLDVPTYIRRGVPLN
jgi:cell division protein FtsZ